MNSNDEQFHKRNENQLMQFFLSFFPIISEIRRFPIYVCEPIHYGIMQQHSTQKMTKPGMTEQILIHMLAKGGFSQMINRS